MTSYPNSSPVCEPPSKALSPFRPATASTDCWLLLARGTDPGGREKSPSREDHVGVFVKSKRHDKLGWGLQTLSGSLLWDSTAAYTLIMRQDQKEYRVRSAGLLDFCSVLKDIWGVGSLRWPPVLSPKIAPMKLSNTPDGHHLPAETSSRYLRIEAQRMKEDASKGYDWSLVNKGSSRQACLRLGLDAAQLLTPVCLQQEVQTL